MGAPGNGELHSDEKQSYGPSWADVRDLWGWVEKEYRCSLRLEVTLTMSVNGKRGLRCMFLAATSGAMMGSCGFGPAYTAGPKTMPAGLINGLYEVQHSIERRLTRHLPWDHPELFPPSR